ncbi:Syntaxin-8, partial [Nibea albiflora]
VLCSSRSQNYDATCRLAQEIAENIHERNRQQRTGGNPAKVTSAVFTEKVALPLSLSLSRFLSLFQINMTLRASLQKLKQNISQLKDGLLRASSSRRIMQSEADRRQNLIDDLLTREKQLNATFKGDSTEPGPSRYEHVIIYHNVSSQNDHEGTMDSSVRQHRLSISQIEVTKCLRKKHEQEHEDVQSSLQDEPHS